MNLPKLMILPISIILFTLTGCGGTTNKSSSEHEGVRVTDAWVAQKPEMTGVFGTLMNHSNKDITITGGSSEVATKLELHETVADASGAMKMRPKPGGFTIKAGSMHELAPGRDHIMLLGLKRELKVGEKVSITLTTSAGDTIRFTAPVKAFSGANENYESGK